MGYTLTDEQLETLFHDFKALADKKKEVYDEDLIVLIEKYLEDVPAHWQLDQPAHDGRDWASCRRPRSPSAAPTARSSRTPPSATARSTRSSRPSSGSPGVRANLHEFVVRSVTQGKDAQGEVTLELEVESDDRSFRGRAASTDIIEASAQAYINAVNAIATHKERGHVREVVGRPGAGRELQSGKPNAQASASALEPDTPWNPASPSTRLHFGLTEPIAQPRRERFSHQRPDSGPYTR